MRSMPLKWLEGSCPFLESIAIVDMARNISCAQHERSRWEHGEDVRVCVRKLVCIHT